MSCVCSIGDTEHTSFSLSFASSPRLTRGAARVAPPRSLSADGYLRLDFQGSHFRRGGRRRSDAVISRGRVVPPSENSSPLDWVRPRTDQCSLLQIVDAYTICSREPQPDMLIPADAQARPAQPANA